MNTQSSWKTFLGFALRVILAHTLTYFLFGMIMSNVFHYGEVFKRVIIRDYMLPIDEHNVLAGPFLPPLRGLIFAIGLWPLRTDVRREQLGHPCELTRWYQMDIVEPRPKKRFAILQPIL